MTTSALSPICMAAGDRRLRDGASLKFFWGPMDCGKSTLALQMDYNHSRQGRARPRADPQRPLALGPG